MADRPSAGQIGLDPDEAQANPDFWAHQNSAGKTRIGVHAECGPQTLELRFRMMAGHDRMHLDQGRRAVRWARASKSR